jgi:hypothetical protein
MVISWSTTARAARRLTTRSKRGRWDIPHTVAKRKTTGEKLSDFPEISSLSDSILVLAYSDSGAVLERSSRSSSLAP